MIKCKIVGENGAAVLIEFFDNETDVLKRVTVPKSMVKDEDSVSRKTIEAGIPYGAQWEDEVKINISPKDVANALRSQGIWTYKDALQNTRKVLRALQAIYGIDLGYILALSRKEGEK